MEKRVGEEQAVVEMLAEAGTVPETQVLALLEKLTNDDGVVVGKGVGPVVGVCGADTVSVAGEVGD